MMIPDPNIEYEAAQEAAELDAAAAQAEHEAMMSKHGVSVIGERWVLTTEENWPEFVEALTGGRADPEEVGELHVEVWGIGNISRAVYWTTRDGRQELRFPPDTWAPGNGWKEWQKIGQPESVQRFTLHFQRGGFAEMTVESSLPADVAELVVGAFVPRAKDALQASPGGAWS